MTTTASASKRELEILNAIAEELNRSADVERALHRTLDLVTRLLGLDAGWIWLIDSRSGRYYVAAAKNLPPYLREPVRMAGTRCWCISEMEDDTLTARNIDVVECSRLRPAVRAEQTRLTRGIAHHATVPLYFQDQKLGILNLTAKRLRRLNRHELRLLSTIAYQIGIAIERARLAEDRARLARDEERMRIARELHDTLAQDLTALTLQIETGLEALSADAPRARERMERALATAQQSLEVARHAIGDLRARHPHDASFAEMLTATVRDFTSTSGVRAKFDLNEVTLARRAERELLAIVREALSNIERHSHAEEIELSVKRRGKSIELLLRDDGRGFDPRRIGTSHHGIEGMRERAEIAGGRLSIKSDSTGTTLRVTVPREEA